MTRTAPPRVTTGATAVPMVRTPAVCLSPKAPQPKPGWLLTVFSYVGPSQVTPGAARPFPPGGPWGDWLASEEMEIPRPEATCLPIIVDEGHFSDSRGFQWPKPLILTDAAVTVQGSISPWERWAWRPLLSSSGGSQRPTPSLSGHQPLLNPATLSLNWSWELSAPEMLFLSLGSAASCCPLVELQCTQHIKGSDKSCSPELATKLVYATVLQTSLPIHMACPGRYL